MKRFIVSIVMFVSLITLFSCTPGENDNAGKLPGGDEGPASSEIAVIYSEGGEDYELAEKIFRHTDNAYKAMRPKLFKDSESSAMREIVVGNTQREITAIAKKALDIVKESCDYPMFLVYSDGNSLAVVYDDYPEAKAQLLKYIERADIVQKLVKLKAGVVYCNDIISEQEIYDKSVVSDAWAKLEATVGYEIAEELRDLGALYTDDLIDWFANLYEPDVCICDGECKNTQYCTGGGYYYSNSGRDTPGYLPDIESTHQAISWISASGMTAGAHYNTVIPEWMESQIIKFLKVRQDPNGYFYHPQWSKESIDANDSRRSRDLQWAISTLDGFGVKPTYDTPTKDVIGDGILWNGTPLSDISSVSCTNLTGRLGGSAVSAVSKVVAVSESTLAPYLVDADGMRTYLAGLDIKEKSYHIGNDLAAITKDVKERDAVLVSQGKESIADVLINWLDDNQNPENGLWDKDSDYYAVDGFFKITFVYNGLGRPIKYIDKALDISINSITSDENPHAVTDVYNTWYNVLNVIENVENYQNEASESVKSALQVLREKAPYAIQRTREKLSLFKKRDGSFSYNQNTTSEISQGMPVALPNTNEGDVNATVIATTGTFNRILAVLGISEQDRVPLYTRADLLRYLYILESLDPVIKDEEPEPERITFTYDELGKTPESVTCEFSDGDFKGTYYPKNGGFEVISDTSENSKRGKILKLESVKGIYNAVKMSVPGSSLSSQCFVFEGDMCIPKSTSGYAVRMRMSDAYAIAFKVDGNKVNLWDVSTTGTPLRETDLGIALNLGEWFNLKVEFYKGDHDTVRIKVYINGNLASVSDNYYDQYGKKITEGEGTPTSIYSYVHFSTMSSFNTTILFDNLMCFRSAKRYEPYTDIKNPLEVNVDAPDPGEKIYTFDESSNTSNLPEDVRVSGGGVSIKSNVDNELNINSDSVGSTVEILTNRRKYGAECFVINFDITPYTFGSEAKLRLELLARKDSAVKLAVFDFVLVELNGEKYIAMADAHEGVTSTVLHSLLIPINKESELTIEYYADKKITVLYLDGKAVSASAVAVNNAASHDFGSIRISTISSGEVNLSIDNVKVESIVKELSVESYNNQKVFDFDKTPYSEAILDNVSVVGAADKQVRLNANIGSIAIPATIRSPLITVTKLGAEFTFEGDGEYLASFNDKSGRSIIALVMVANNGSISLYEYTDAGRSDVELAKFNANGSMKICLEWYKNEQMLMVTFNEKPIALTALYYSDTTLLEWVDSFKLSSASGSGYLTVDNLICENTNSEFKIPEGLDAENSENNSEKITFETTSSSAKLPSAITYKLSSPGASFKVEQLIRDGKINRVISMTSRVGGNDAVRIGLTKKIQGANCVTFEADMYMDYADSSSWRNMQFWIQTKEGNSSAYMFEIWDSSLFSENGGSSNVAAGFTGVRTWFTIKAEYYDGGFVIIYVNGTPIYTGDGYRGKADGASPVSASSIERVNVYPYGDFAVTYKLDNISLIQEVKTYVAPEIEKEPESELGKVEDVLTFEDGLVNEATDFASGSINGTTAEIEEESDGNHILVFTTPASSKVNNIINVNYTKANADLSNGIVFEFDVNITYTKSDDYLYIQLRDKNGASAAFISIENNSIVVYSSSSSYEFGSIKLTKGEMSRVKVEYGDTDSGVFIRISVNGSVSYEKDAYLSRDGKSISSADISYIELSTWRQITAKMDNMSFYRATLTPPEKKEPEVEEKLPEVYDFESGDIPSSMPLLTDNTCCVVEEDTERGKYLNFTTAANTWGTGFYVPVLTDENGANCLAFEADMSLNVLSGAGLRFQFMNESGGCNMWFEIQKNGTNLYFLLYTKSSSNCYAASDAIAVNGNDNWFNLRVEYYEGDRNSVRTKVYVNEKLVFVSDMFMNSGSCGCSSHGSSIAPAAVSNTAKIRIRNDYSAYSGTLYIDNIKFERIVKECEDDAITAQRP